MMTAIFIRNLS